MSARFSSSSCLLFLFLCPRTDALLLSLLSSYGIQKDDAVNIIHQSVEEGSVIRVKYKDSISYRNPAKFPRSAAHVNQVMMQKQRQLQQHLNGGGSGGSNGGTEDKVAHKPASATEAGARGAAVAGAASSNGMPLAPIPAIKKILRAIRTLTTKSGDPAAGASVQQVISLIGQRELGFPPTFVSRVLKAGVIQGQYFVVLLSPPSLTHLFSLVLSLTHRDGAAPAVRQLHPGFGKQRQEEGTKPQAWSPGAGCRSRSRCPDAGCRQPGCHRQPLQQQRRSCWDAQGGLDSPTESATDAAAVACLRRDCSDEWTQCSRSP